MQIGKSKHLKISEDLGKIQEVLEDFS